MFDTEKSAMGEKGQIQFGTVLGGSAKVAVFALFPGADAVLPLLLLFPDVHPVSAKNDTAIIPNSRKIRFRFPPCVRKVSILRLHGEVARGWINLVFAWLLGEV